MPEGHCGLLWVGQGPGVSESVCVKLNYPIVRGLCCDDPESAGTRGQWSPPGGWPSLITIARVTNIKYASDLGRWRRERERAVQCSGSGHESEEKKTHCEDLCGQA